MSHTTRTPRRVKAFLKLLAENASIRRSAMMLNIPRQNIYEWRKQDAEFAKQMDAAIELGSGALEDEAVRRAYEGWEEPVFYQGDQVGTIRKYSDGLLTTLLKARLPHKYKDNNTVNISNDVKVLSVFQDIERDVRLITGCATSDATPDSGIPPDCITESMDEAQANGTVAPSETD